MTFDDLPFTLPSDDPIDAFTPAEVAALQHTMQRLMAHIETAHLPATGFVTEGLARPGIDNSIKMHEALLQWSAVVDLGNHTYSHLDLHRRGAEAFVRDILRGEALTRPLLAAQARRLTYFRHPYLNTGLTTAQKQRVARFLAGRGYRVAPVTMDPSDWFFAAAYALAWRVDDAASKQRTMAAYLAHLDAHIGVAEQVAQSLLERPLPQVLLLHANALNADGLPAVLATFERRGYCFVSLTTAMQDPAYAIPDDDYLGGGTLWFYRWARTLKTPHGLPQPVRPAIGPREDGAPLNFRAEPAPGVAALPARRATSRPANRSQGRRPD